MVSASQLANTLGAVVITDGGVPRTFTAMALETISGGQLVSVSGATNDVGSDASSYITTDIKVIGAQDIKLFNGMALNNAASGAVVTIATRGSYLMKCGGIVSGGALVQHNASGCVANLGVLGSVSVGTLGPTIVGRAKTTSASGTTLYSLIELIA